jgi:hypothetical protein
MDRTSVFEIENAGSSPVGSIMTLEETLQKTEERGKWEPEELFYALKHISGRLMALEAFSTTDGQNFAAICEALQKQREVNESETALLKDITKLLGTIVNRLERLEARYR